MMTSSFIQKFIERAAHCADKTAIVDNGGKRHTSYGELMTLARKVAAYIHMQGIEPQSFIVVKMPYCMEYMAADLGIWLSRQVAVPIGDKYPRTRIDYIVRHCDCRLILTLETMEEVKELVPAENIIPGHTDNAMLLYTSGSTGNPKGALITYEVLDNGVPRPMAPGVPMENIVFGGSAPLYFAFGNHIWNVLHAGGTLHLYSEEVKNNISLMEDYIAEHGITMSQISPAALVLFHNRSKTLRYVITAGEKLSTQYSKDGYTLYNLFGQTETMLPIIAYQMPEHPMDIIPIGKCMLGIEMMVADENGNPLPKGQTGEMCLRGPLFKEYYKEPELTAQAYHNGWLHTKDLVYLDDNGDIIYVNRKDWMVKVNGQRVEPGEVETTMLHIDGVRNAIVKGFDNGEGSQYLCAYFIAEADVDGEMIRTALAAHLPSYMVPSYYVRLYTLPLNANGKVDRKNLQAPDTSAMKAVYAAPTNETEATLCDAYSSVLAIDRIGINDDFFMLGGNSIRVMKLQLLCSELPLSSRIIYTLRTPKAIAAALADASFNITHGASQAKLTQTQLGIYTACIKRPGEAVYNNPFLFRLSDKLDVNMLVNAIEVAVGAHPVLNATIGMSDDGEPLMINKSWDDSVCIVEKTSEDKLRELMAQLKQPFDLHRDRLCRVRIIETELSQYIFIDVHHIIFDGTSMHILMSDIDRAYRGETIETEHYTAFDIATDEDRERNGANYAKAKEWYRDTFGTSLEVSMPLPDRYGEGMEEFRHDVFTLNMTASQLEEWCSKHDVTANLLTTLAFGKTLSAFTMTDTSVFSTIYNGRSNIMTAKTMAMLVKALPVVIDFTKDDSISALLANLKLQMLGAMANDIYSFAELATDTGISSEVAFAYQADMHQLGTLGGAKLKDMELDFNATGEPFLCQLMTNVDNQLTLDVQYRSDKYSADFVRSFFEAYSHILGELCHKETMAEVTVCNEDMLAQLDSFNAKDNAAAAEMDADETVLSLFQKAAKQYPDNIAVVFKEKKYTYKQLDELTDKIGAYIYNKVKDCGKEEPVVSIILYRNEWMVLASLATLKAGCAYQPLDPSYPQDRLNFMVKDADAALLIADSHLRGVVNEYEGEVLLTDNITEEATMFADSHPNFLPHRQGRGGSSLFTLLYTSGSTGVPKGVMLEHGNLIAFNKGYRSYLSINSDSKIAAYASFGFDANMQDIYCTLMNGATLHIIDEDIRLDLEALHQYFEREGITHSFMTTQVAVQYLENYPQSASLQHLSMGGEKLRAVKPEKLSYQIHNGYGPSETTCGCAFFHVKHWEQNIPIGTPTTTCKLYIVDKYGHRIPAGASGELWINGPQVGRGYLNRPDKTAESFTPNPFGEGRVYHSGDIVRYRQDGNIEFVGRKDGQVKIRGFRIELKEVEAVIRDFPDIKDVTVQAFDDPSGGKFIAAYIVSDKEVDIEALNQFILNQKPPYMVPAVTMRIAEIPLNVNQKVNKKALPEPSLSSISGKYNFVELHGELEKTIGKCMAETLAIDVSNISAHDTFISLGGTSVKSIRLMLLLKKNGIELAMEHLLKQNNIRNLALIADYAKRGEYVEKRTTLMPAQMRMLKEHLHNPDRMINTVNALMDIDATITEEHIQRAISAVAKRHPAMRSAIAYIGVDIPMQVYLDRQIPLFVIDTETEKDAVDMMMDQSLLQRQAVSYLQQQPLFQLSLFRIGGMSAYLMLSYNNILAEEWKMRTWIAELFDALKENGGDSINNWCYILNTAIEANNSAEHEDWSKESNDDVSSWTDMGLDKRGSDDGDDNYKVLTETPGTKQLVFVHSGNTGSEAYQSLANALDGFCSFSVLDQWNLYHRDDIKHGITEIASKYVEVLLTHHPHGPYYLGGWCYGGIIAYEMACQLTAMGEKVEQLFIFDAFIINQQRFRKMYLSQTGDDMREYFMRTSLFSSIIGRGLLDNLVANSLQVNYDMTNFIPKHYDGNVLYFKSITPSLGVSEIMDGFFKAMNQRRAGGFEKCIPRQKLHIVDIMQEHDNLMNEASLSIEVPVMKQYLQ